MIKMSLRKRYCSKEYFLFFNGFRGVGRFSTAFWAYYHETVTRRDREEKKRAGGDSGVPFRGSSSPSYNSRILGRRLRLMGLRVWKWVSGSGDHFRLGLHRSPVVLSMALPRVGVPRRTRSVGLDSRWGRRIHLGVSLRV